MSKRLLIISIFALLGTAATATFFRHPPPQAINNAASLVGINTLEVTLANSGDLSTGEAYDAH